MSNNLADLILSNRSSLSSLIAAYDAETAGAEIEYRERIAQAEAHHRTATEAARNHFEEGLRRAGITLFDLQGPEGTPDDGPDFANVGHLPEPLPRSVSAGSGGGTFVTVDVKWQEHNGTGEAQSVPVAANQEACPGDTPGDADDGAEADCGDSARPAMDARPVGLGESGSEPDTGQPERGTAETQIACSVCGKMGKRKTCLACCGAKGRAARVEKPREQGKAAPASLVCPDCGDPTPTGGCCNRCRAKRASEAARRNKEAREAAATVALSTTPAVQPFPPMPEGKAVVMVPEVAPTVAPPEPLILAPAVSPRQSVEDLFDPSVPPPASPEGDIPDYLKAVTLANRMPEPARTLLNAEIHAGLQTYRPRRFEIHQDIATGAYYAVDFRHETEPGSRAILWMQMFEGKPFPTFFPPKGGIK